MQKLMFTSILALFAAAGIASAESGVHSGGAGGDDPAVVLVPGSDDGTGATDDDATEDQGDDAGDDNDDDGDDNGGGDGGHDGGSDD